MILIKNFPNCDPTDIISTIFTEKNTSPIKAHRNSPPNGKNLSNQITLIVSYKKTVKHLVCVNDS
jgi:hypothetical protein